MKKLTLTSILALVILSGCDNETEEIPTSSLVKSHDLSQNSSGIYSKNIEKKDLRILHKVEYNNSVFEVETIYSIEKEFANSWYYTIPNELDLKIKTNNLPENLEVVVSNVYSDISVSSKDSKYNGIRQDSMILDYTNIGKGGFNINDKNFYSQPFQIEGVNTSEMFISLWNGYGSTRYSYLKESEIRENSDGVLLNAVFTLGIFENSSELVYNHTIRDKIFIKNSEGEEKK